MKTFGIVCEYNPFHKGHELHIRKTRRDFGATHIICVMSGSCVQRGDFAIYDKWTRAKAAVMGGADLVIELPTAKAVASAEKFAYNAVSLLNKTGIVDGISFGSECGDIEILKNAAAAYEKPEFSAKLKAELEKGVGYHNAYSSALTECDCALTAVSGANNLLGIEYIKALNRLSSSIEPFAVKREGAGHDSMDESDFPSASLIRKKLFENNDDENIHGLFLQERAALALLRNPSVNFAELADVSEGIENRLAKAIAASCSLSEIYEKTKTKRYSMSRIRRLVLSACLGLTQNLADEEQNYIRILALNCKGAELIEKIRNTSQIRVITRFLSDYNTVENMPNLAKFECKVSDLYGIFGKKAKPCGSEFTNSPIFVK